MTLGIKLKQYQIFPQNQKCSIKQNKAKKQEIQFLIFSVSFFSAKLCLSNKDFQVVCQWLPMPG
jgi:hypothetical protein